MAYSAPITAVTGATFTAAQFNTSVRDNLNAIWVGTNAGDVDYYASSSTKARLAKPSVTSLLQSDSGGVPSWLALASIPSLHTIAYVDFLASDQTESGGTYTDVTNATLNLTLTKTCTVIMYATAMTYVSNAAWGVQIRGVIDGTANPSTVIPWNSVANVNVSQSCYWAQINIASGTRVCKLQFRVTSGGATAHIDRGNILAFAFG